jgi:hypothetical protein
MKTPRDIIDRLPELPLEPFEVAGTLGQSKRGPYLTIRPHSRPAPKSPVSPSLAGPNKSSFSTREYATWVTYPRLHCYDPGDLLAGMTLNVDQALGDWRSETHSHMAGLAQRERLYKLSTFNGVKLPHPYWCSVRYGPWLAIAIERESCIYGESNFWELFIAEVPEVGLSWYGAWEDMPPYPSLQVMRDKTLVSEEPGCCAGFKWCATTRSCIPEHVNCADAEPV